METYWVGDRQKGIRDHNGRYCVVDLATYEFSDCYEATIEYVGSYEDCVRWKEIEIMAYNEARCT